MLALIATIVSLCFNWLMIDNVAVNIHNDYPLLVLALLATLMPLMAICRYKNLRVQKLISKLGAVFSLFTVGYVVALSFLGPNPEAEVCILAPCLMGLSCILDCLAVKSIVRDINLLKSADRLR
ncbi:MAG: DUF4293 family protein [Bacteroides sp.]|nr:DUF4293 family protein [Bacteroides sp.]MCM1379249.1 DUF4293 family protein [Bacteroides sp.]MCM1445093.1 DUF4293 family protein [Prevotella sp.]